MDEPPLPTIELDPEGPAHASVIWLHGLGADGNDFVPIVGHLDLPADLGVRFVFPTAPSIPVTVNGGMSMPAWYDIAELGLRKEHDEEGIRRSAARVLRLVERESRRVGTRKVVLAGFSQGGAIALHLGLRHPEPLAGILALSTYLVLPEAAAEEQSEVSRDVPVFQAHGRLDPMVPPARGLAARDQLRALGMSVSWHEYPMGHEVCLEEIQVVGAWLAKRLGAADG